MRQRSTFIVLSTSLVESYEGSSPTQWEDLEFSHWLLRILRGENSRSALRAALAAIRVWLQKLCNSLSLPRSACFTQLRLQFYTDRCRVCGQRSHARRRWLQRLHARNYLPPRGLIGACTPCMHCPTGRHNVRGPQVYKGCRFFFYRRTIARAPHEYMKTKRFRKFTNVEEHGSQVIYAYTYTREPEGGSLQEDQSYSHVSPVQHSISS